MDLFSVQSPVDINFSESFSDENFFTVFAVKSFKDD